MAKFRGAVLKCKHCGNDFKVPPSRSLTAEYCSRTCKYQSWVANGTRKQDGAILTKACLSCGKEFETYKSQNNDYCSYACYHHALENKETRLCAYCGEPFSIKKSAVDICCSKKCRDARSKTPDWPTFNKQLRVCVECGKEFYVKQCEVVNGKGIYCSKKCRDKSMILIGLPAPQFYTRTEWKQIRLEVLDRDGNKCQQCGFNGKGLHIHHIKRKRYGGTEELENLITLCHVCHMKTHANEIRRK